MMTKLAAWWIVVKKYWGYFQAGRTAAQLARTPFRSGSNQADPLNPREVWVPPPLPPIWQPDNPLEVGVDWSNGIDISVYRCGACDWETSVVEELVKHMKQHGATRLTVLPVNRPPGYRFGDRR